MAKVVAEKFLGMNFDVEDYEQGKRLVLKKRFAVGAGFPPAAVTGTPIHLQILRHDDESGTVEYKIDMMPVGPLSELIEAATTRTIEGYTLSTKFAIAYAIALQVKKLHENMLLHRDLVPRNIIVDETFYPVLLEWKALHFSGRSDQAAKSWAPESQDIRNVTFFAGDFWYRPPELLEFEQFQAFIERREDEMSSQDYFNRISRVDTYMFGMLLYELFTGITPFSDQGSFDDAAILLTKCREGLLVTFNEPNYPGTMYCPVEDLIRSCVKYDPRRRPKMADVVEELRNLADDALDEAGIAQMEAVLKRTNKPDEPDIHGTVENLVKCARKGIPWSKNICDQFGIKIE